MLATHSKDRVTVELAWKQLFLPCFWYEQSIFLLRTACSGGRIVSWIIYCWLIWCERKILFPAGNLRSFTSKRTCSYSLAFGIHYELYSFNARHAGGWSSRMNTTSRKASSVFHTRQVMLCLMIGNLQSS